MPQARGKAVGAELVQPVPQLPCRFRVRCQRPLALELLPAQVVPVTSGDAPSTAAAASQEQVGGLARPAHGACLRDDDRGHRARLSERQRTFK
jgi:hypothetical protein